MRKDANRGLAIHVHHNKLIEWCWNYNERVYAIKNCKPNDQIVTRLRLFKLLPRKAIDDLPKGLRKNWHTWEDWFAYSNVLTMWNKKEQRRWHRKWCGCKEWNGKEIVFPK